jgi:membrane-bound lytic murein transglycosylase F
MEDIVLGSIEIIKSSNHEEILNSLKKENPKLKWISLDDINSDELVELVNEGLVDYTIINSNEYEVYSQFYPNIKIARRLSSSEPVAWAFSLYSDSSLSAKLYRYCQNMSKLSVKLLEKMILIGNYWQV